MNMFEWKGDMVRFMRDASEWNSYHSALSERICGELTPGDAVCDAGCGLGYLSLELARRCRRVTALDVAPQALAVLEENIRTGGVKNIDVLCRSVDTLSPDIAFDAAVFCMFGDAMRVPDFARAHGCKKAILIRKNWDRHRFSASGERTVRCTLEAALRGFSDQGIPCRAEAFTLELSQPFRSAADAMEFFRLYARPGSPPPDEEEVLSRLQRTGDKTFPLLLPVHNRLGMITLNLSV